VADQQGGGSWLSFPWRVAGALRTVARRRPLAGLRDQATHPQAWRGTLQSRLMAVAAVFALWTVGIEARLIYLQVVAHADLTARADRQQLDTIDVPAKRGEILDRHGRVLAYSVDADTVFANPLEVEGPDRTASLVCGALDACDNAMRQSMAKMLRKRTQFA
jgi:hypothetical protein